MNEEKIHNDELYLPFDESIVEEQTKCLEKLYDYNATSPLEKSKHEYLFRKNNIYDKIYKINLYFFSCLFTFSLI